MKYQVCPWWFSRSSLLLARQHIHVELSRFVFHRTERLDRSRKESFRHPNNNLSLHGCWSWRIEELFARASQRAIFGSLESNVFACARGTWIGPEKIKYPRARKWKYETFFFFSFTPHRSTPALLLAWISEMKMKFFNTHTWWRSKLTSKRFQALDNEKNVCFE